MRYFNTLVKIFLITLIVFNVSYALQEDRILSIMTDKINKATQILQNNQLDKVRKQKDIFDMFDVLFDYELMAKLSLGKQWNILETQQQKVFTQSFEQRLKSSYIDKLYLYTNQKIIVKEMVKPKDNRIEVVMHILGEKETFEVIYKFYKNGIDDWFIYDVNILGISIIQTYRNQFVGVLQKETFDELIQRLNKVEAVIK
jgi:phospholipid transport system substrate-binding protein